MSEPLNLTSDEIRDITGAIKKSKQAERLRQMGFVVIVRPDGRPIVSRSNYLKVTGGLDSKQASSSIEPDFESLYGT